MIIKVDFHGEVSASVTKFDKLSDLYDSGEQIESVNLFEEKMESQGLGWTTDEDGDVVIVDMDFRGNQELEDVKNLIRKFDRKNCLGDILNGN